MAVGKGCPHPVFQCRLKSAKLVLKLLDPNLGSPIGSRFPRCTLFRDGGPLHALLSEIGQIDALVLEVGLRYPGFKCSSSQQIP